MKVLDWTTMLAWFPDCYGWIMELALIDMCVGMSCGVCEAKGVYQYISYSSCTPRPLYKYHFSILAGEYKSSRCTQIRCLLSSRPTVWNTDNREFFSPYITAPPVTIEQVLPHQPSWEQAVLLCMLLCWCAVCCGAPSCRVLWHKTLHKLQEDRKVQGEYRNLH